jgi:hypothetical protein
MFQDLKLFDEFSEDSLRVSQRDRERLKEWGEAWIVKATSANPGKWIEEFRPRLFDLLQTMTFQVNENALKIECRSDLHDTLVLLSRGSTWFDGVDNLELELFGVVMSR